MIKPRASMVTFKLPLQEQGTSMLNSRSSSWQIRHSTIFRACISSSRFLFWGKKSGSHRCTTPPATIDPCIMGWLPLWIAAARLDSVSRRSTSSTKWPPMSQSQQRAPGLERLPASLRILEDAEEQIREEQSRVLGEKEEETSSGCWPGLWRWGWEIFLKIFIS